MRKSTFIYVITHLLQFSGTSADETADVSCQLSRSSAHGGFHR